MTHEEKASEIVEQHLGYICVNQLDKDCPHCEAIKVISSALAEAEKKAYEKEQSHGE